MGLFNEDFCVVTADIYNKFVKYTNELPYKTKNTCHTIKSYLKKIKATTKK